MAPKSKKKVRAPGAARARGRGQPAGRGPRARTHFCSCDAPPPSVPHSPQRARLGPGRARPGPQLHARLARVERETPQLGLGCGGLAADEASPPFCGARGRRGVRMFRRRPGPRPMLSLARRSSSLPLPLPPTPPQVPAAVAGAQSESGGSVIAAGGWHTQLRPGLAGGELAPPIELFASPPRPRRLTARRSKKTKCAGRPPLSTHATPPPTTPHPTPQSPSRCPRR